MPKNSENADRKYVYQEGKRSWLWRGVRKGRGVIFDKLNII